MHRLIGPWQRQLLEVSVRKDGEARNARLSALEAQTRALDEEGLLRRVKVLEAKSEVSEETLKARTYVQPARITTYRLRVRQHYTA